MGGRDGAILRVGLAILVTSLVVHALWWGNPTVDTVTALMFVVGATVSAVGALVMDAGRGPGRDGGGT